MATAEGVQQKLTANQRQTISLNECLLYMHTGQVCAHIHIALTAIVPGKLGLAGCYLCFHSPFVLMFCELRRKSRMQLANPGVYVVSSVFLDPRVDRNIDFHMTALLTLCKPFVNIFSHIVHMSQICNKNLNWYFSDLLNEVEIALIFSYV